MTEELKCPYCNGEISEPWLYFDDPFDSSEVEVSCPHACKNKFILTADITIDYEIYEKDNTDMNGDWQDTGGEG